MGTSVSTGYVSGTGYWMRKCMRELGFERTDSEAWRLLEVCRGGKDLFGDSMINGSKGSSRVSWIGYGEVISMVWLAVFGFFFF